MEEGRQSSGYMRPFSSDEDHSKLSGTSPSAATATADAASASAVIVANAAAEANPPDAEALSLGIWRPWGVGLSLRLSDVFEVIFYAFLTPPSHVIPCSL